MKVMARVCGYNGFNQFNSNDLTICKKDMAKLSGIKYCGPGYF
jgi:hypothetical protein